MILIAKNRLKNMLTIHFHLRTLPPPNKAILKKNPAPCFTDTLTQRSGTYGSRARWGSFDACIWLPVSQTNLNRHFFKALTKVNTSRAAFQSYHWCLSMLALNSALAKKVPNQTVLAAQCDTNVQMYWLS